MDTIKGLDSEIMLKLRVKFHKKFLPHKLCKDHESGFKFKQEQMDLMSPNYWEKELMKKTGVLLYIDDPHASNSKEVTKP